MNTDIDIEKIWKQLKEEIEKITSQPITAEDLKNASIFHGDEDSVKFVEYLPAEISAHFMAEYQKPRKVKIGRMSINDYVIDADKIYEYIKENMPETFRYVQTRMDKGVKGGDSTIGKIIWESEERMRMALQLEKGEFLPFDVMVGIIEEAVKRRPPIRARKKK